MLENENTINYLLYLLKMQSLKFISIETIIKNKIRIGNVPQTIKDEYIKIKCINSNIRFKKFEFFILF